jgi:flagellar motor switch protein FliM
MSEADNNQDQDEEALEEWNNMLSSDGSSENSEGSGEESKRHADEINPEYKGIKAVLDQALQSYEKLPMLEVVFERLVRLLTTSLRNLTSENVDLEIASFNSMRYGDYIDKLQQPSLIGIFKANEWENYGITKLNANLVFSLVDLLFGGKKNTADQQRTESREYTLIEQSLMRQFSEVVLNELSVAFDPITTASFSFERIETNPNFVSISRPGDAIILLTLNVYMEERGGTIDLILPYNTLEPVKDKLTQMFMGEKFGADAEWKDNLTTRLHDLDFEISAVIEGESIKMSELSKLKVGNTIILTPETEENVIMRCGGVDIMQGNVGKINDKLAFENKRVLIDDSTDS